MKTEELDSAILAINPVKRFIICTILNRKQWKIARAYSKVCCDHLYYGLNWDALRKMERERWAKVYGFTITED